MTSPSVYANIAPLRFDVPLSEWTTLKVGGPAEWFFEPRRPEDLGKLLEVLNKDGKPFRILGGGANVLISDEGVRGAVIHTGKMRYVFLEKNCLRCWPGATIVQVVRAATEHGLSGIESLVGVPGNIGGALAMNAGSIDFGIWDVVKSVTVWEPGKPIFEKTSLDVRPRYRNGNLGDSVVLEALLELKESEPEKVKERQQRLLRKKNASQPVALWSAGCAFKNPQGASAGYLLDRAGVKGKRCGSAVVSELHANFIVNEGGASSKDVLDLLNLMAEAVRNTSGINLERELVVWRD